MGIINNNMGLSGNPSESSRAWHGVKAHWNGIRQQLPTMTLLLSMMTLLPLCVPLALLPSLSSSSSPAVFAAAPTMPVPLSTPRKDPSRCCWWPFVKPQLPSPYLGGACSDPHSRVVYSALSQWFSGGQSNWSLLIPIASGGEGRCSRILVLTAPTFTLKS